MNFSSETITLLENFASINKSMLFLKGTKQKTISMTQTVFAEATIAEDIPQEFGIYDLNQFLGVLSLFEKPMISFNEHSLTIQSGKRRLLYKFCNPELIISPPKDKNINIGNVDLTTAITSDDYKSLNKAISILGQGHVAFQGDGSNLSVRTLKIGEDDSDGAFYELGETDKKFTYALAVENMKLLSHDYDIDLTDRMFLKFKSKSMDLTYILPCDKANSSRG